MVPPRGGSNRNRHDINPYVEMCRFLNTKAEGCTHLPFGCTEPISSEAKLPSCPESCNTCADQFLTIATRKRANLRHQAAWDDGKAQKEVDSLVTTVQSNFEIIRTTVEQYGDAVAKRWQKRSPQKRAALLKSAMPDIYAHRGAAVRIAFEGIRVFQSALSGASGRSLYNVSDHFHKQEDHWIIPYVDLPTLTEDPGRLLTLIHHRSHSAPWEWVMFDSEQIQPFFSMATFDQAPYNPHCVGMTEATFGKLLPWEEGAAHRYDIIGYPRAFVILKSQAAISGLLVRVLGLLMQDRKDVRPGREYWDERVTQNFGIGSSVTGPSSIFEQAFGPPPTSDFDKLLEVVRARRNAALDEVWLLQTDPAFLRRYLQEATKTKRYPKLMNSKELETKQLETMFQWILQSVGKAHMWRHNVMDIEKVQTLYKQHCHGVIPGMEMPADYAEPLSVLHYTLESQLSNLIIELKRLLPEVDTYAHVFSRGPNGKVNVMVKRDLQFSKDPLLWHLMALCEPETGVTQDPVWHIAYVDDLLSRASTVELARIDAFLYGILSNLAVVASAIVTLRYHKPHLRPKIKTETYSKLTNDDGDLELLRELYARTSRLNRAFEKIYQPSLREILSLPLPPSRPTSKSFGQWLDLQEAMQEFWQRMREGYSVGVKGNPLELDDPRVRQFTKLIDAGNTAAYDISWKLEMAPHLAQKIAAEEREAERGVQLAMRMENNIAVQTTWGETNDKPTPMPIPASKTKLKTRPKCEAENTSKQTAPKSAPVAQANEDANPPFIIEVTKASKTLFSRMYSVDGKATGNVRWDQVVAALVDAGCSVTNVGGSHASVKDEKNLKGTVLLDRPHRSPDVHYVMLRAFGKRFAKWFGWGEETFIVRQK